MKGKLLYEETQKLDKRFFALVIIITIMIIAPLWYGFFYQIVLGNEWGNEPMSDSGLTLLVFIITIFCVLILLFAWSHTLKILIDQGTIRYLFNPYINSYKTVHRDQIKMVYVRKYKPVLEYGGWGYRFGFHKGKAYNIWGRWGLQLEFNDGKKLLLGTQNPGELERIIEEWKKDY